MSAITLKSKLGNGSQISKLEKSKKESGSGAPEQPLSWASSSGALVIGRQQKLEPTAGLQDVVVVQFSPIQPKENLEQIKDLLNKTNEDLSHRLKFFKKCITALLSDTDQLKDPVTHEVFSPSDESDLSILKAVMTSLNSAEDYDGPYTIESIKGFIRNNITNPPGCRGTIEKIVSFKDYLEKIKEDINDFIKNSDNKNKLNSLVDQLIDQCDLSKNEDVNEINESLQGLLSDASTEDRLSTNPSFFIPVCLEAICHSYVFVDAILNSDQSQSQTALASLLVAASAIRTLGGFCLSSNRNNSLVIGWLAESMIFSSTIGILANSWEEHGIFPWQNGFNRPYIVYAFLRGALDFVCLCLLCCQCD